MDDLTQITPQEEKRINDLDDQILWYQAYLKNKKVINQELKKHKRGISKSRKRWLLKIEVLSHYSKGVPECACCKEKTIQFLAINHLNGGGNEHRRSIKNLGGERFYRWLIKNNYPEGYSVLCHNCNMAIGFYGECPHEIPSRQRPYIVS